MLILYCLYRTAAGFIVSNNTVLLASCCALGYHVVLLFMPSQACNVTYIILEIWSNLLLYLGNMISLVCMVLDISASENAVCLFSLTAGVGLITLQLLFYIIIYNHFRIHSKFCTSPVHVCLDLALSCRYGLVGTCSKRTWNGPFSSLTLEVLQLTAGVSDLLLRGCSLRTAHWLLFMISSRVKNQRGRFSIQFNDGDHKQYI